MESKAEADRLLRSDHACTATVPQAKPWARPWKRKQVEVRCRTSVERSRVSGPPL